MFRRTLILFMVALAALAAGCARRVPMGDLEAGGAQVGAVVVMGDGETFRCRVLSLSRETAIVEAYYVVGGDVALRGSGDERYIAVDGRRVPGEIVEIRLDEATRTVTLRRSLNVADIDTATFHRSGSEASLGPILSALVGPVVGALLALLI